MYSGEADVSPTRKTLAYIFLKLELGGVRKPNMQQLIVFILPSPIQSNKLLFSKQLFGQLSVLNWLNL
jgi:hypothetical protein